MSPDVKRVLLVEDNPLDARRIRELLRQERIEVEHVARLSAALKRAANNHIDLILLDLCLPDSEGLRTLTQLHAVTDDIPIVVLTGLDDESTALSALELGAQDYLVKGQVDQRELTRAVVRAIARKRIDTELKMRASQQSAVGDLGQRALHGAQLPILLREAVAQASSVLGAELCGFLEYQPGGGMRLQAGVGWSEGLVGLATVSPLPNTVAGSTLASGGPLLIEDLSAHPEFSASEILRYHRAVSGVSVLVGTVESPLGVLAAWTQKRRLFSATDASFLKALANIIAEATVRARNERSLREAKERYQRLVQVSPDGVAVNVGGKLVFVNDAMVRLLGAMRPEQLIGRSAIDFIHPDDREMVLARMKQVAERRELAGFHIERFIRLDGSIIELEAAAVPFIYDGLAGAQVVLRDISERRRAEAALRRSEAEFRSLFEGAPYGIFRSSVEEDRFLLANFVLVEMLGYAALGELLDLRISRDVYEDPLERTRILETLQAQGVFRNLETVWKRKDGSRVLVRLSGRRVQDPDGNITTEVIAEDITSYRNLEQQFRQAQKLEAVGRLAGSIAHDFNNVLMVISGSMELLARSVPEESRAVRHIRNAQQAADRAASLTRQLLAFSRKQVLQPRVMDVREVVFELGQMLHGLIEENIEVVIKQPDGVGQVKADPGQIHQVLMNLVVNARDAMSAGGRLTIEVANAELGVPCMRSCGMPSGRYVMLAVSDTGHGMDEMTKSRIFEPFYTTKEKGKGTGLGLPTVYGIVKQSGGCICVHSEVAVGTTFKVYLPRVDAPVTNAAQETSEPLSVNNNESVLLVEDSESLRSCLEEFLVSSGYKVLVAKSGPDALAMIMKERPAIDVVLTDVIMPGMNGRQFATHFTGLYPTAKVIFMSGYTDEAINTNGILDPGVILLQKPFTLDTLARTIRQTVQG